MKRYTMRILLCLLLGVVTTIGVAWGSILWTDWGQITPWPYVYDPIKSLDQPWPEPAPCDWPDGVVVQRITGNWVTQIEAATHGRGFESDQSFMQISWQSGLPMRALKRVENIVPKSTHRAPVAWREGLSIPSWMCWKCDHSVFDHRFPLIPILPGFLINTIFFAVIWFCMFFGIGVTRRVIRRKRGHCPICTYNLRGDFESGCSECGWNRTETEIREVEL